VNRQEIAALSGIAEFRRESGTWRGTRPVWGGRAHVRAVLSMSMWAAGRHHPVLTAFDARRAGGNAPAVALTAGMRKLLTTLNAMRNHQTPWHESSPHHA
jgi:transposase